MELEAGAVALLATLAGSSVTAVLSVVAAVRARRSQAKVEKHRLALEVAALESYRATLQAAVSRSDGASTRLDEHHDELPFDLLLEARRRLLDELVKDADTTVKPPA